MEMNKEVCMKNPCLSLFISGEYGTNPPSLFP